MDNEAISKMIEEFLKSLTADFQNAEADMLAHMRLMDCDGDCAHCPDSAMLQTPETSDEQFLRSMGIRP